MYSDKYSAIEESNDQEALDLDFTYQQIKELSDKSDIFNDEMGDSQISNSLLRGFIIEKKIKHGFPIFRNEDFSISILDFKEDSENPLILEVIINFPTSNSKTMKIGFNLNIIEIEEFINKISENIKIEKLLKKHNYNVIDDNTNYISREGNSKYNEIKKHIAFNKGSEQIILLRANILKLPKNNDVLNVNQVHTDKYIISCKSFYFSIEIEDKKLIISHKLEDNRNIDDIESAVNEIDSIIMDLLEQNQKIFGKKTSKETVKKSSSLLKKLFGFGHKDCQPLTSISFKNLKEMRDRIKKTLDALSDIESIFNRIDDDMKEIARTLIDTIVESSKDIGEYSDSKDILYINYLIKIFNKTFIEGNLVSIYQYIIGNKELYNKYGDIIKSKLSEHKEYKDSLFVQLNSPENIDYYKTDIEKNHDMVVSEDSMQIIFTSSEGKLLSYNMVTNKLETIVENEDVKYEKISKDGKYLLFDQLTNGFYSGHIYCSQDSLRETKKLIIDDYKKYRDKTYINKIKPKTKYYLYKNYSIKISAKGIHSKNHFSITNLINRNTEYIDFSIDRNLHCFSGDYIYFFESDQNKEFPTLNSYNILNGEFYDLGYLLNHSDNVVSIKATDNKFYIFLKNSEGKLILRTIDISEGHLNEKSVKNYDIDFLKYQLNPKNIHISDDGYILSQNNNNIYIFNMNEQFKTYKLTPKIKINNFSKVVFINSPIYGHFAVCRDGNQIHKIDIGLIEEFLEPTGGLEKKMKLVSQEKDKEKETSKVNPEHIDRKKPEKGTTEDDKEGQKTRDKESLPDREDGYSEIITELRETRAINAMILEQLIESNKLNTNTMTALEKANQINTDMVKEMKALKKNLS